MATYSSAAEKVLEHTRKAQMLRPRDLEPYGIPRTYLGRLCQSGQLLRIGRGLYVLPESKATEHRSLVQVCKLVPNGVVCLLSALRFHDLTTQTPNAVWLAIGEKAWRPRIEYPMLRVVYSSHQALNAGVEQHKIEGVPVQVYSVAKTVADCFKYRNKIGLDVAIEALRDCRRARSCTTDDLWHHAEICRVQNVMRPYLESIVA